MNGSEIERKAADGQPEGVLSSSAEERVQILRPKTELVSPQTRLSEKKNVLDTIERALDDP